MQRFGSKREQVMFKGFKELVRGPRMVRYWTGETNSGQTKELWP